MEACSRHPDRKTPYRCAKHEITMCEECMACRDPGIYCKHRSACAIHFMEKERRREQAHDAAQTGAYASSEAPALRQIP